MKADYDYLYMYLALYFFNASSALILNIVSIWDIEHEETEKTSTKQIKYFNGYRCLNCYVGKTFVRLHVGLDCAISTNVASVFAEYDDTAEHPSKHHQWSARVVLGIVKQGRSKSAGWQGLCSTLNIRDL